MGELVTATTLLLAATTADARNFVWSEGQTYMEGRFSYTAAEDYWGTSGTQTTIGCQSGGADINKTGNSVVQYSDCKSQSKVTSLDLEYGASYYYTLYVNTGYGQSQYIPKGPACGPAGTACPQSPGTPTTAPNRNYAPTEAITGPIDSAVGIRGRLDPYENYKTWELEAEVPTSAAEPGQSRLGCGVWGGALRLERKTELASRDIDNANGLPYLALELGAAGYYWQKPLNPQARAYLGFSGNFNENWGWFMSASGYAPIAQRATNTTINGAAADCGTSAKTVSATLEVKHQLSMDPDVFFNCGGSGVTWGRDVSKSAGGYCGLTALFK